MLSSQLHAGSAARSLLWFIHQMCLNFISCLCSHVRAPLIAFQEIYGFPKDARQLTFALEAGAGRKDASLVVELRLLGRTWSGHWVLCCTTDRWGCKACEMERVLRRAQVPSGEL